ncbi:colicin E3-like toxin immunity protein [Stutzerimonas stutzeri]|uniref:colicin E3-like toxin immunity protein n=2 Tax=Stutzerimonas stutzeri group TaxID=136846 RepID=UPI003D015753
MESLRVIERLMAVTSAHSILLQESKLNLLLKAEISKNTCEGKMGLRIRLNWYDKHNDLGVGREYSDDMGDDTSIIELLSLPISESVNNGEFDISIEWSTILQPYFKHKINLTEHDYQVAFDYRDAW